MDEAKNQDLYEMKIKGVIFNALSQTVLNPPAIIFCSGHCLIAPTGVLLTYETFHFPAIGTLLNKR
jgi:hypothetical protein